MIINRDVYLNKLIKQKDKDIIKIITGMRRTGKSILLFELFYNFLLNSGIQRKQIIKIAFDSKKNESLKNSVNLYSFLERNIDAKLRTYILLDEIQLVDDFEDVINGIKADFDCDIYITGSNSKMLSTDINTKFRGRGIEIKVFPLSFKEYYDFYKGNAKDLFNKYMVFGGLPFLLQENDDVEKANYLNMICSTMITKDILERYSIRNVDVFESVANLLCSNIGSYISSNKIVNTLKSNGFKTIDNEAISKYLSYLCDSFLFYKVNRYDIKGKEYLKTLNKYYISDIGIRNAKLNFRQIEKTHTIENIVFLELLSRGYIVNIGKNNEKEIDFVASSMNNTYYIQVCFTIENEETRERELNSFSNLDDGYKKILITTDEDPFNNLKKGYKKINIIDFLLDYNSLEKI